MELKEQAKLKEKIKGILLDTMCCRCETANNAEMARQAMVELQFVEAKVKFLSVEPLLNNDGYTPWRYIDFKTISWLVIGGYSGGHKSPPIEAVRELVQIADRAGIPVWLKDNLYKPLMELPHDDLFWADMSHLRQEFPARQEVKS